MEPATTALLSGAATRAAIRSRMVLRVVSRCSHQTCMLKSSRQRGCVRAGLTLRGCGISLLEPEVGGGGGVVKASRRTLARRASRCTLRPSLSPGVWTPERCLRKGGRRRSGARRKVAEGEPRQDDPPWTSGSAPPARGWNEGGRGGGNCLRGCWLARLLLESAWKKAGRWK